jgi:hypothetical protein
VGWHIFISKNNTSNAGGCTYLPKVCRSGIARQQNSAVSHHAEGTYNAEARCLANDSYPGGLGDKMEDWVERLHQWGIQQRRHFRTVQIPLVHATA